MLRRFAISSLLLVTGFSAGLVLTGRMRTASESLAETQVPAATPGAPARGPKIERGQGHVYGPSVTTPSGTTFTLTGTSAAPTSLTVKGIPASAVVVKKDAFSTATFG